MARRKRESNRFVRVDAGSELLLLSPRDAERYVRKARLRAAVAYPGVVLLWFGLLAVTYAQVTSDFDPALGVVGLLGAGALGAGIIAALLTVFAFRVTPVVEPLTRAELDGYPGGPATAIRFGLAELMPDGIGPGECRPLAVARNRTLRPRYESCWNSVESARTEVR